MTDIHRQFSTGPAWGETHLAMDAIVAFVDEELSPGARRRALAHLAGCRDCGTEVVAQTQARLALRAASAPCLPSSLLRNLRAIPHSAELPSAPAGLAVGPGGELVTMLRPAPVPAAGSWSKAEPASTPGPAPVRRRPLERRVRLGAGAVVSGLALGALMVSGTPSVAVLPDGAPSSGVLGSTLDARLRLEGGARNTAPVLGTVEQAQTIVPSGAVPSVPELARIRRAHQQVR